MREKLLEPFERGDVSYSGRIEGNGLGMALVKNIIDIMQGEIYVDSTIGEGTTIRTILHLKKSVEVEKQDDKAKKIFDPNWYAPGKTYSSGRGQRIEPRDRNCVFRESES